MCLVRVCAHTHTHTLASQHVRGVYVNSGWRLRELRICSQTGNCTVSEEEKGCWRVGRVTKYVCSKAIWPHFLVVCASERPNCKTDKLLNRPFAQMSVISGCGLAPQVDRWWDISARRPKHMHCNNNLSANHLIWFALIFLCWVIYYMFVYQYINNCILRLGKNQKLTCQK